MIVGNVTREQVQEAADNVRIRVSHEGIRPEGRRWRLVLVPGVERQWQRTSPSMAGRGRRVNAACWHGYYAFMRELYRLAPDAVIRSTMATYRSADELEDTAWQSETRNVGSQVAPVPYSEACQCDQSMDVADLVAEAQSK